MATLIRCPRCKSENDASAARPGSVMKCAHCRGDMRVPDEAKAPAAAGGGGRAGGRQSTLFRKMTNASVPGQRGRTAPSPGGYGGERGASERSRDMSGVYMGAGIAALIAVVIAIGFVLKGKSEEPVAKGGGKGKGTNRAPIQAPPPVPPAPPPEPVKPPDQRKKGPPLSWEPDASSYTLESVKPLPTDATAEKDALHFIRTKNSKLIIRTPFRYLPFVINSMISEDRELAHAAFVVLNEFADDRKEYDSHGKPILDLAWVNDAEYRGYMYMWWNNKWWPERASKLPDAPGNQAVVDKQDWVSLVRELKGGAYHDLETPQGVAFQKVKNLGKAAWMKLAELVDHEDLSIGQTASHVLGELTGEKKPRPTEQTRSEVKNAWIAWIQKN